MLDVLVVGAGLSGLICARRLVGSGARVLVIEARDRVGGRLHTGVVGGAVVDLGGQWLTAGQPRLRALARELDVQIERHDRSGRVLLPDGGGVIAAFAQWRAMRRIERLMRSPGSLPRDMALEDWLAREVRNTIARERIALHADLIFAADRGNLSLLHYLSAMKATSGFRPQGADEYRFAGGAQLLAARLAEQLGHCIRLAEAAVAVEQTEHAVTVRCKTAAGGRLHEARRVVIAMPPPLVKQLAIDLPDAMRLYRDAAFGGPVVKCFAAYAQPFWRAHGHSGESFHIRGAVRATVELAGEPPVLLAFIVGNDAARWSSRSADERHAEVLTAFARFAGASDAPEPLDYLEHDWSSEPWSAGCVPGLPPGIPSGGARWREPHGRIHIAGTESATTWPGYMEGAVESGERAAGEVLAAL